MVLYFLYFGDFVEVVLFVYVELGLFPRSHHVRAVVGRAGQGRAGHRRWTIQHNICAFGSLMTSSPLWSMFPNWPLLCAGDLFSFFCLGTVYEY